MLTIPKLTQTGDIFRIPNGGYIDKEGARGDLLLVAKIMIPKVLSDSEKELFSKLKSISRYNPRGN